MSLSCGGRASCFRAYTCGLCGKSVRVSTVLLELGWNAQEEQDQQRSAPPRRLCEHLIKGRILFLVDIDLSNDLSEFGFCIRIRGIRGIVM